MNLSLISQLEALPCGIKRDVQLSNYTSFKIGGNCKLVVTPDSLEQIPIIIDILKRYNMAYYFLGNGTNMLVSDEGYDGVIIHISNVLSDIKVDDTTIECFAGATLTRLCNVAHEYSLSGLEFAFGIPGSVGGAVYMNAGAYGGEIKDVITSCTFIDEDNKVKTLSGEKLLLSYRHSIFSDTKMCILKATFQLKKDEQTLIRSRMSDFMERRITKQPLENPSAGSTFKRPNGNYASALIEQCGLKGSCVGGAMVSTKHSGFVINTGNATCKDVLELVDYIKLQVLKKTGYMLECEMKML